MNSQSKEIMTGGPDTYRSLLPAIFNIFRCWQLTDAQQMFLLGAPTEKVLYSWKGEPEKAKLTQDTLEHASYILGIYRSLQILFPQPGLADRWLSTANDNPLFKGATPIDSMLAESIVDLAIVRNFLDAQRSGY